MSICQIFPAPKFPPYDVYSAIIYMYVHHIIFCVLCHIILTQWPKGLHNSSSLIIINVVPDHLFLSFFFTYALSNLNPLML